MAWCEAARVINTVRIEPLFLCWLLNTVHYSHSVDKLEGWRGVVGEECELGEGDTSVEVWKLTI